MRFEISNKHPTAHKWLLRTCALSISTNCIDNIYRNTFFFLKIKCNDSIIYCCSVLFPETICIRNDFPEKKKRGAIWAAREKCAVQGGLKRLVHAEISKKWIMAAIIGLTTNFGTNIQFLATTNVFKCGRFFQLPQMIHHLATIRIH